MLEPTHLIADLTCLRGLDDAVVVERFMRSCIAETGLTIEDFLIKEFTNGGDFGPGITGMALLSESHMVVHTAPERQKLNLDLFSCRPFPDYIVQGLAEEAFGVTRMNRWELLSR